MKTSRTPLLLFCFLLLFSFNLINAQRGERKGFMFNIGAGAGYSNISSNSPDFLDYGRFGLGINYGLGGGLNNRSALLFSIKSNIFVDDVVRTWGNWVERMQGDDLAALGAILISPFVFMFTPIFRSHGIYGSLEYLHFVRETAPCLLFSGSTGMAILYDKNSNEVSGGFAISLGTGYEFQRKLALQFDVFYSNTQNDIDAMSMVLTLRKYMY